MSNSPTPAQQLDLSFTEYSHRLSDCGTPICDLKAVLTQAVYPTDRSEALVRVSLRKILTGVYNLHQLLHSHQPQDFFSNDSPLPHQLERFAAAELVYNLQLRNFTNAFADAYQAHITHHGPLADGYNQLMQCLHSLQSARDNYLKQFHNFRRDLLSGAQD